MCFISVCVCVCFMCVCVCVCEIHLSAEGGVTVARLEEEGQWLIANCVAIWLVGQKVSPHTIGTLTGHGM